jgi:hypothetical protein
MTGLPLWRTMYGLGSGAGLKRRTLAAFDVEILIEKDRKSTEHARRYGRATMLHLR